METIAAHGNCLFRRFGVLLRDEGQYNVHIAEAYILYSEKKKLYSTFPQICCTYVVTHKYVPRNIRCAREKTDSEAVMSK